MQTHLTLEYEQETDVPPEFEDDVRTPEAYVRHFLREYSEAGDRILDPFAGFGTTLAVAEELDRVPYGVEYEADRVEVVVGREGDDQENRDGGTYGCGCDLSYCLVFSTDESG